MTIYQGLPIQRPVASALRAASAYAQNGGSVLSRNVSENPAAASTVGALVRTSIQPHRHNAPADDDFSALVEKALIGSTS